MLAPLFFAVATAAPAAPILLTNHLGYELAGHKRAVVQARAADRIDSCAVLEVDDSDAPVTGGARLETVLPKHVGPVANWRDWDYWLIDFSDLAHEGRFRLTCASSAGELRSFPFRVQKDVLERHTLSDVLFYFKGQRSSGRMDEADRNAPLDGRPDVRVDAHGGWYDASGDYGKHLSHLSFSSYFNPQQQSLAVWALLEAQQLLTRRSDRSFRQFLRRLADEAAWGADYLVRIEAPGGSFYRSVQSPGPAKRAEDRRIGREYKNFAIKTSGTQTRMSDFDSATTLDAATYQSSLRAGAGVAIAALARAAAMEAPGERRADYLKTAREAWAFLAAHNAELTNDGRENIVDDYCALLAASELFAATHEAEYLLAADARATRLLARLAPGPRSYWRADDGDRPFFHAAEAGFPVVSLLAYAEVASPEHRAAVLAAVRASLDWELRVSDEVPNPFGYARQLAQTVKGVRETRFFFPHDTETAPWWQGENARLASLAFAARLAAAQFAGDPAFASRLRRYAQDQLDWILGKNPFDVSMLHGTGRNNPEYMFFGSYEYSAAPGGIVNGITSGFRDERGIDFDLPYSVTGADNDWRWVEQWLPHASWYLLAVAAGDRPVEATGGGRKAVIAYVFPRGKVIDPGTIAAGKLTHINYAFANVVDGLVVEGAAVDAENYRVLAGLRRQNPQLQILVSVGGWIWSGAFSDAALTPESRARFVASAVDFVRRHDLDGFDVDWEYPGLPGNGNTHRPEDKQNFTALMSELRGALDKEGAARGRHFLLTFAAGALPTFLEHTEMDKVQAVVDYVNLMTYDFRESGDRLAGHHANLMANPNDDKGLSADAALRLFLKAGVPAHKLVLGVPFYGHAWADVAPVANGLYQPGRPPRREIDASYGNLARSYVGKNGYLRFWDEQAQAPFLWNEKQRVFISYEDPQSLRVKCRYLKERGLAGVMFWQYYSDASGALLQTLDQELGGVGAR
jgi:GH18 family chitinase